MIEDGYTFKDVDKPQPSIKDVVLVKSPIEIQHEETLEKKRQQEEFEKQQKKKTTLNFDSLLERSIEESENFMKKNNLAYSIQPIQSNKLFQ